jgi:CSLREA domain-containing protein
MKMNRRRALINFTLTLGLLLNLGLLSQLDLPGWRVQASHGSPGNQAVRPRAAKAEAAAMLAPLSTITVNSTADGAPANNGACTLREALMNANGANQSGSTDCAAGGTATNTIIFSLPAGPQTITLTGALPDITRSLTITGPGAGLLTVGRPQGSLTTRRPGTASSLSQLGG